MRLVSKTVRRVFIGVVLSSKDKTFGLSGQWFYSEALLSHAVRSPASSGIAAIHGVQLLLLSYTLVVDRPFLQIEGPDSSVRTVTRYISDNTVLVANLVKE